MEVSREKRSQLSAIGYCDKNKRNGRNRIVCEKYFTRTVGVGDFREANRTRKKVHNLAGSSKYVHSEKVCRQRDRGSCLLMID